MLGGSSTFRSLTGRLSYISSTRQAFIYCESIAVFENLSHPTVYHRVPLHLSPRKEFPLRQPIRMAVKSQFLTEA